MGSTSLDDRLGEPSTKSLLGLPVELRECIYEYYLSGLVPTTLTITKGPERPQWALITQQSRRTPGLLLACRTIYHELRKFVLSMSSSGPIESVPLSRGPTIKIDPPCRRPFCANLMEIEQPVEQSINLRDILLPILLTSAPSMRLHLIMPQIPAEAMLFTSMLRFLAAICDARVKPLKHIYVVRDPLSGPGPGFNIDAIVETVSRIRCESMEWENWYRPWYASASVAVGAGEGASSWADLDIDEAWEEVIESCREHERTAMNWRTGVLRF